MAAQVPGDPRYCARVEALEIALIGVMFIAYAAISRRVERLPITMPIIFVGLGALTSATGVVEVIAELEAISLLAEVTLAVILFSDAVRIDLHSLRNNLQLPARLLFVAMPLIILLGTGVNAALLPYDGLAEMALLAAILAPTDAALGSAVIEDRSVPLRERITLNVESGLNDGLVAPVVAVLISVASGENRAVGDWVVFAFEQVGYGVAIGLVIGAGVVMLLRWTRANGWSDGRYEQIATFAVPIVALCGAEVAGGNGFISAFMAGLTFGAARRRGADAMEAAEESAHLAEFTEDAAQMLGMVAFFVFGNVFLGEALGEFDVEVFVVATLSLTLVRLAPVWLSLLGTGLRLPTILFDGWFGPRGLASIAFAILLLEEIEELGDNTGFIVAVITITVSASVLLHGLSAAPLAQRYGAWASEAEMSDDERHEMEMPDLEPEAVPRARWSRPIVQ